MDNRMPHLLVRHKVADFPEWKRVFDSHASAQRQAGLSVKHLFRNTENPNEVFILFEAQTLEGARGFVTAPDVPEAQHSSGVLDTPDIYYLEQS
jgi:hypothetical protein